ncbi:HGGxSTG domain-containing protein [Methylobacterium oxalidis]|nr:HGGxSTG domain-containing protein [Methylobacterium oxalidis]
MIDRALKVEAGDRGAAEKVEGPPHEPCGCARLQGAFAAPRCGARRRDGGACMSPAMKNGRCRFHGGKSTGARTPEGRARAGAANLRHGYYSAAAVSDRREARRALRLAVETLRFLSDRV